MAAPKGNKNTLGKHWKLSEKAIRRRRGKPGNHLGHSHTEETKRKISESRKGKTAKDKNPAWKGGIREKDYVERRRFQKTIQKKVFERDDYTCQICGVRGGDLQVDHIQPWSEYIELRFSIDNCRTLCVKCHYKITFGKPMPPKVRAWGHNILKGGNIL